AVVEVCVVRPARLAGILVLDIGRTLQRIRRTAHAPPRRRRFLFWHGHAEISSKTAARLAPDRQNLREAGLIEEASRQGQAPFREPNRQPSVPTKLPPARALH